MQHSEPSIINALQLYRPSCSKCGSLMMLARIEPAAEPGHDLRAFECETCGRAEIVEAVFR
jgi:DNA-directed RNA polymerase subunit M/transcription elongation factor TFIIS